MLVHPGEAICNKNPTCTWAVDKGCDDPTLATSLKERLIAQDGYDIAAANDGIAGDDVFGPARYPAPNYPDSIGNAKRFLITCLSQLAISFCIWQPLFLGLLAFRTLYLKNIQCCNSKRTRKRGKVAKDVFLMDDRFLISNDAGIKAAYKHVTTRKSLVSLSKQTTVWLTEKAIRRSMTTINQDWNKQ